MLNFSSTESEGGEIDVLSVSHKKGPDRKKWKRKRNLALYQSKKKRKKAHQTPYPANPDPDEVNPDEVAAESGQATTHCYFQTIFNETNQENYLSILLCGYTNGHSITKPGWLYTFPHPFI